MFTNFILSLALLGSLNTPPAHLANLELHGEVMAISRVTSNDYQFVLVVDGFMETAEFKGNYSKYSVHDKVIIFAHKEVTGVVYDWLAKEEKL